MLGRVMRAVAMVRSAEQQLSNSSRSRVSLPRALGLSVPDVIPIGVGIHAVARRPPTPPSHRASMFRTTLTLRHHLRRCLYQAAWLMSSIVDGVCPALCKRIKCSCTACSAEARQHKEEKRKRNWSVGSSSQGLLRT